MKLKLTATIKKEALFPGMETVDLQKELNPPAIVQQVNKSDQALDQALDQLNKKYPTFGEWKGQDLITDLESLMKEYPNTLYGIGFNGSGMSYGRLLAFNSGQMDLVWRQKQKVKTVQTPNSKVETVETELSGTRVRRSFTHKDKSVYVLVTF